jgi:mannitol/fructose-specific phosphotransferase system IIA component (Ntr-type)
LISSNVDFKIFDHDAVLALVDFDKMRQCHIINCLAALSVVMMQKKIRQKVLNSNEYDLLKQKIFGSASCSVMIDTEFDDDDSILGIIS